MNDSLPAGAASYANNHGTKRPRKASPPPAFQKRDSDYYMAGAASYNNNHGI